MTVAVFTGHGTGMSYRATSSIHAVVSRNSRLVSESTRAAAHMDCTLPEASVLARTSPGRSESMSCLTRGGRGRCASGATPVACGACASDNFDRLGRPNMGWFFCYFNYTDAIMGLSVDDFDPSY